MYRFTASLAVVGLLTFLLTQTDRVLLSRLLPLADFGRYMLAATLAYGINRLAAPINIAVQPRFSELVALDQIERLKSFYHSSNQVLAVAIVPAAVVLAVCASDVLRLWTGSDDIAQMATPILALLAAGYGINATMTLAWSLQVAYGQTRFGLVQSIVSVLLAVPSIAWGATHFGALGAASVWLLLNLGYFAISMPLIHRRILRGELAAWYLRDVAPITIASLTAAALTAHWLRPLPRNAIALAHLVVRIAVPTQYSRNPNQHPTAAPQHAAQLPQQRGRLGDVLEHVVHQRRIEAAVLERQHVRLHQPGIQPARLAIGDRVCVDVDADRVGAELQEIPDSAAHVHGPPVQPMADPRVQEIPPVHAAQAAAPHQVLPVHLGRGHAIGSFKASG